MTRDFDAAAQCPSAPTNGRPTKTIRSSTCILVTGGTGSLVFHLIVNLAERPDVATVLVLNRRHEADAMERQLQTYGTDMSKPLLGLPHETYAAICSNTTHIIHAAWAMLAKRPISGFQCQFHVMRNLIKLARDAFGTSPLSTHPILFEFVSSIAVVGHYPLRHNTPDVPEDIWTASASRASCPMAMATQVRLRACSGPHAAQAPAASCVSIGQIAGATASGYWNTQEHLPLLLRFPQTLHCLPRLEGLLSWTPVDRVAGALADLVLAPGTPCPVYNIDNPVRQLWSDVLSVLADGMGAEDMIPFQDWVGRVRAAPAAGGVAGGHSASLLLDFLDKNLEGMSCGTLLLSTDQATKHSPTLLATVPVSTLG
ncbi:hypothetical protein DHEL01_v210939 [Diaporthe helianthi]|uniref:Thioester reductase (TE) domain-containing protein n=1 Tax=Diaporthe helianthi TaxID=158607 RepID=A0A2P5HK86_DIAHE|nr:hypothetical protein DHEL01_v210939 [Diaporthe helianthi]